VLPLLSKGFPTTEISLRSLRWVGWARPARFAWLTILRTPRWLWAIAFFAILCAIELRTSWIQSKMLAEAARRLTYTVEEGSSPSMRYPAGGPYDRRLGYALLLTFLDRLSADGFRVEAQARWSPLAVRVAEAGFFPVYSTKTRAGLSVLDRHGHSLWSAEYPARTYRDFDEIPPIFVRSLLFIENRELLGEKSPYHNPAIEYDRFVRALLDVGLHGINPRHRSSGGSTIATQIEKFRHSPGGRTDSMPEKGRQIFSASLRAYLDGESTLPARQRLVADYLNSMPLGAIAGHGEVHGIGDGLSAWYDADFQTVNEMLAEHRLQPDGTRQSQTARAFRQVLSLLVAVKKPSAYLSRDRQGLDARIDRYLPALASAGVIPAWLRDEASRLRVAPRARVPAAAPLPPLERKAVDAVRAELSLRLGLPSVYDLDRLDLTIRTTLDDVVNAQVTDVLQRLGHREYAAQAGLTSHPLLANDNPGRVVYGVTFYERGPNGNEMRVQADNYPQPLNINQGTKLELGSTAKLRTLTTYLETVERLHAQYAAVTNNALRVAAPRDRLSRWAVEYLTEATDRSLPAMLEAAMNRRYSASPAESFFTGGGLHHFHNFDAKDNRQVLTVREAFQRSVNLVFIRLMRDVVGHHSFGVRDAARILAEKNHPARVAYITRFADREGSEFLRKFYRKHRMASVDSVFEKLVQARSSSAVRVAVLHRSTRPDTELGEFAAVLNAHRVGRNLSPAKVRELYDTYHPARWSLNDRGYLSGVHPLELWLLGYLRHHPEATLADVLATSYRARQDAYSWLFKTSNKRAQDRTILTELEIETFAEIHASWRRHGYPFPSLVPSYATAIGSSGDNPAALSELLGIILNDGVRHRSFRIDQIRLAERTPYETHLARRPADGDRMFSSAVASLLRRELVGVVEHGTGRRVAGGVVLANGRKLDIGGKTGTGDNRFDTPGPGGTSRVVNRTAAFTFIIGDRFFGTVIAYVPGRAAAAYGFTSALPAQVFKHLLPTLSPLLHEPTAVRHADASS
jgi:membrane peptidoglycan carboxypeptidase